jgi:hypothetical protein
MTRKRFGNAAVGNIDMKEPPGLRPAALIRAKVCVFGSCTQKVSASIMHDIYMAHASACVNRLSIRSLSADSVNPELPSGGISKFVRKSLAEICHLLARNFLRIGYSEKRRAGNNAFSWKSLAVISGFVGKILTGLTNSVQTDFLRVDSVGKSMADNAFAGKRPARISGFAGNGPEELTNRFTVLVEALA